MNMLTPDSKCSQLALAERHTMAIGALVVDVGSDGLMLGSVRWLDETIVGGTTLLQILRHARVSE